MKRIEIIAKGDVQRVGYRDMVEKIACKLKLAGFVENLKPYAAFLSLYGYCRIEAMLKSARLLSRISPMDLLEELSKVYIVGDGKVDVISEVPRKVAELEEKLGCDVFPE